MFTRGCSLTGILLLAATPGVHAQVVQLPTFHYFSVQTSVLAPDNGRASLGSVRRSTLGQSTRGVPWAGKVPGVGRLFGSRGIGGSSGASGASVYVTVIDQDELDRAVLAEAARQGAARVATLRRAEEIARGISGVGAATGAGDELTGVAEIRQRNSERRAAQNDEASKFFAQGQQAEAQGQPGVAKIFYRMAEKRAGSALKREISLRLATLR